MHIKAVNLYLSQSSASSMGIHNINEIVAPCGSAIRHARFFFVFCGLAGQPTQFGLLTWVTLPENPHRPLGCLLPSRLALNSHCLIPAS
jgi:hypothetical protein